jgi:hypothetical protein
MSNEVIIKFEDYEKYILPVLKNQTISSVIFYYVGQSRIRIKTFMNGFVITTFVEKQFIVDTYKNQEIEISITPLPEMSESDLLNKFNQDYMDARGIPELGEQSF